MKLREIFGWISLETYGGEKMERTRGVCEVFIKAEMCMEGKGISWVLGRVCPPRVAWDTRRWCGMEEPMILGGSERYSVDVEGENEEPDGAQGEMRSDRSSWREYQEYGARLS